MPLERPRPPPGVIDTGHPGDDAQLREMQAQAHLVTPRRWSHFLFFPDEQVAHDVGEELANDWEIDVLPTPDGSGWTLSLTRTGVTVSDRAVRLARAELTELCAARGGEYDGWRAWI